MLSNIQEFIGTGKGVEGSLLIVKKIHDTLLEEAEKMLIPRALAAIYIGPEGIPGSSYDFNYENEGMNVYLTGEGAEYRFDELSYTDKNIKPLKYGVAVKISREMLEDGKWNLLDRGMRIAGKRIAENENRLVITALDNADNTVAAGASVTIADLTLAMNYLEEADREATDLLVGAQVLMDIRNIDSFTEVDKSGDNEMMRTGYRGVLYGMNVHRVSTRAGMTTTSAYALDREYAYVVVEKRPVSIEGFKLEVNDMEGATISQRIAVDSLHSDAICKITSS